MARSAIFVFPIAAILALSGCRTSRPTPDIGEKPAVPQSAPAPAAENSATVPAPPATQPAPAPTPAAPAPAQPHAPATAAPSPPAPAAAPTAKPSSTKTTSAPKPAASPPVASESKAQPAPAAPKPSSLDLNSLEQKLKDTRAIGVFTKLSLKNQVDDLLSEFRAYHKGGAKTPQSELRQKYDLLIMKVLSLLQNGDPQLASAIASSREALWGILMDPQKFANI
jgi:outer membrane biosynthesis protein TonB